MEDGGKIRVEMSVKRHEQIKEMEDEGVRKQRKEVMRKMKESRRRIIRQCKDGEMEVRA